MRPPLAVLSTLLLAAPVLAGCTAPAADLDALDAPPALPEGRPAVVIAVIDTGINLYHAEYRLPGRAAAQAASAPEVAPLLQTLGVPEAIGVNLTLDLGWDEAVERDWDALMEIEPKKLYTFPGTRILGAISFYERAGGCSLLPPGDCYEWPLVLDEPGGHGTMTTSRAVGNTISIGGAEADIHLVLVQGFSPEAVRWVADQDWIDIASISAGISFLPVAPGVATLGEAAGLSEGIAAFNYLAHRKPFFASTGNGWSNAGVLGFPSWLRGASGAPDVISVGANDNGRMSQWHNQDPYVAADGCRNPSADSDDAESVSNHGGGTSSATPFSAGGGAKLLLEARRILGDTEVGPRVDETLKAEGWSSGRAQDATIVLAQGEPGLVPGGPLADGVFTLAEFKQTLYLTALATPTEEESDGDACPVVLAGGFEGGENLPPQARFPLHGYGEVNHASIDAALAVIRGEAPMPERPEDDAQYHAARARKTTFVGDGE